MMTNAANAGGIRVGFGFPLGSFVAHPNQNYSDGAYERRCEKSAPAATRRSVRLRPSLLPAGPTLRKSSWLRTRPRKRRLRLSPSSKPKLPADAVNTTVIAKTADNDTSADTGSEGKPDAATLSASENNDGSKVAASETTANDEKTDANTAPVSDGKKVCRRFSPTIAALVDVPCE